MAFLDKGKDLRQRAQEYIDGFPDHVWRQGGQFYLPIPDNLLEYEQERPKFAAMCDIAVYVRAQASKARNK